MSAVEVITRIATQILTHPVTHQIARYAIRQATAALVRHIRSKTGRGQPKTWTHFGSAERGGSVSPF